MRVAEEPDDTEAACLGAWGTWQVGFVMVACCGGLWAIFADVLTELIGQLIIQVEFKRLRSSLEFR